MTEPYLLLAQEATGLFQKTINSNEPPQNVLADNASSAQKNNQPEGRLQYPKTQ